MISTSNLASKRLNVEILTDDENGIRLHDVDVAESASDGSKVSISELSKNDIAGAPVHIFTDDILPEIFNNLKILTGQDLLNFRLVNRCWRNSATLVLLKRNLCQIFLNFGKVTTGDDSNAVCEEVEDWKYECQDERFSVSSFKYFSVNNSGMFLEDLNRLISTSPKFPSASIRFQSDCGRMLLRPPFEWPHGFPYQTDLLQFFSIHGMEIRKLSLEGEISIKALQNLLYVHMPHLTCLDIDNFSYVFSDTDTTDGNSEENPMQVYLPFTSTLKIKSISVGLCETFNRIKAKFLKDLISVCPNLGAIYNASEAALEILIENKKHHLIKELEYSARFFETQRKEQVAKLVEKTIFEKKLPNFQLNKYCAYQFHIQGYGFNWMAMNIILSASKDSLKHLRLGVRTSTSIINFFVPSLPCLEYLELNNFRPNERPAGFQFKFVGDVIGRAIKSGELTSNKDVSDDYFKALVLQTQGINNIPADYFPRLLKVRLPSLSLVKNHSKLEGFFSLEHLGPDGVTTVPGDTVPTVTTLEFSTLPRDVGYMPKLFPNVTHLNFHSSSSRDLRNWVWTAFPKLKRLQISGDTFDDNWDAETVDCFFTGISQELRANCYGKVKSSKLDLGTENEKDVRRTQSYIEDCENVKEFKIDFWGKCGSHQFASVAVYKFQKNAQRTKSIFSILAFLDPEMSSEEIEETLQDLEPVTAYVEIRMNK